MGETRKVVWITGAGTGIGEAVAMILADAGHSLILTGRRVAPLEQVAEAVRARGGQARIETGDMSHPETATRIAESIRATEGRLDVLVNNAGTNLPGRSWAELTPESIGTLVDGNMTAAFLTSLAALGLMRPQGAGILIHTASIAGRIISTQPGSVYTAAKRGVIAMSHTINLEEAANGIRSMVICPGDVATPLLEQRPQVISAEARAAMLQPEHLADLVRYLINLPPGVCIPEATIMPARR